MIRDPKFPKRAIVPIQVGLWSDEDVVYYLKERISVHTQVTPPPCTDEERWMTDDVYAVHKTVGDGISKRAVSGGLHKSSYDAESFIMEKQLLAQVVKRPGKPVRCQDWCNVSEWCEQYRNA